MPHAHERIEFAPPAQPAPARSFGLAVLAHLFLLGALTWGVNWKRQTVTTTTAEAELWASVPQQAAPPALEPPPPPPPEPIVPKAKPPAPAVEEKPAPPPRDVDIAVERERQKKKQLEKELAEEKEAEKQEKLQEEKQKKAADKKAQDAAQKKAADDAKNEAQRKTAETKKLAAAQAAKDEQQSAQQREANLKRMAGIAGASGDPSATGSAQQSAGPVISNNYGDRIANRVRPNIVFTGDAPPNARVELDIRLSPDGTILGRPRITKSSGYKEFDEAVVRGFEKTEVLPRSESGSAPSNLPIGWTRKNTN